METTIQVKGLRAEEAEKERQKLIREGIRELQFDVPRGVVIDGIQLPQSFIEENVRSAKSMIPRADDIFVCTYPKSGTTWIQHIVHLLLGKAAYEEMYEEEGEARKQSSLEKSMWSISPMVEEFGAVYADKFKSPRVLKTHLSYGDIPKGGGSKYIYTCRNPKDVLTSYYHHHKLFTIYGFANGKFDVFFDLFMDGKVDFGDYFNHFISWLEGMKTGDEQILFLKYEDMLSDLRSAVIQIGCFLGGNAAEIVKDEEQLAKIVEASMLSSMKKDQGRWFPTEYCHQGSSFIRKGGSRDWKNLFSHEQSTRIDERFQERCAGTEAAEWWQAEMEWNETDTISRPVTSNESTSTSALH